MPFKGVLFARRLIIQGAAIAAVGYERAKIIGAVFAGNPQLQFFTGSPDETGPALVWVNASTGFDPDQLQLQLLSPETADGSKAALLLTGNVNVLNRTLASLQADVIDILGGASQNGLVEIDNAGNINLSSSLGTRFGGAGGLNGRRIIGIGGDNDVTANTSGGNGTLDYSHSFGTDNFAIVVIRNGAANQIMSRIRAGDTSTTFQCRVQNNDGTSPANGTAINISWIGISWA